MKVGILGFGVVGKKLYELLKNDYEVVKILDNQNKGDLFTENIEDIIALKPDTIFECLPNIPLAFELDLKVLNAGINLISSNKAIIQTNYKTLVEAANKNNVSFSFEAAVAGGIPFLHNILDLKKHDNVVGIKGIINGTTNYILDSIFNNNMTYEDALNNAIKLGYAEANYSSDVDGDDVAYKVCLAMSLIYDTCMDKKDVVKYGIRYLNDLAINYAKENDKTIKLIGFGDLENVFVLPMFISNKDVYANISKNYNCVEIFSDNQASIKLIGQGAGGLPTADAMVSDLIRPFDKLNISNTLTFKNDKKFKFVISNKENITITETMEINKLKDIVKDGYFVGGIYD